MGTSKGAFDTSGMLLCPCDNGCTALATHSASNTWDVAKDEMHATRMEEFPLCVTRSTPHEGGEEVFATYSTDFAFVVGGCSQNTIDADGYWWADNDKCVYLNKQSDTQMSYILKSSKADCTNGWHRRTVTAQEYEMI